MLSKKNYNAIDIAKLIMAICVVSIHTHPFENCSNTIILSINDALVNLAVPFFFITSGFLLGSKFDNNLSNESNIIPVKKSLIRILKMYIVWTTIYLPLTIYNYIHSGYSVLKASADFIRGLIVVGQHYNSWQLWYLLSTVYTLILVIIAIKTKLNNKKLSVIALFFLIISIVFSYIGTYQGDNSILSIANKLVYYTFGNGRIFLGAFYIPVGIIISKAKLPRFLPLVLLIAGFTANVLVEMDSLKTIFTAISAIGLFEIIKRINLKPAPIYPFIREISTDVYLIHMYIWTSYYMIFYGEKTQGFDSFIVTSIVSVLISAIYVAIKKHKSSVNVAKRN